MNFKRINNITGWIVCLIACTVYIMTTEAGGSLWDCGEFVSSCFKVQIPHPPGAPLFILLGRIFILLFGNDPHTAAKGVNVMSALASGFTILFLFWTITHYARKIVRKDVAEGEAYTLTQIATIMGAGAVGALAYTFTDSFWYSAVEGEVYAMSSFFTAIVFWGILKWENHADEKGADKWIVFIFFLIGMSIGVHLLCLLCIPAIVMAYYFKRRPTFNYAAVKKYFIYVIIIGGILGAILAAWGASSEVSKVTNISLPADNTMAGLMIVGALAAIGLLYLIESINKDKKEYYGGAYIFFVIGAVVLGIVQVGIIQYSVKLAGEFDIFFVNSLHAPFFSGFAFFFVLLAVIIWIGLRIANNKKWGYLRLAIWCITFTLIGYSTYLTTMIRSNADPAVDMYNVDNPQSLVGYLGRDQYGDFPILYGQKFDAQPVAYAPGSDKYQKIGDKYVDIGPDGHYVFQKEDKMIFPRMWDMSEDQGHATYYAQFMGVGKNKDGSWDIDKDEDGHYLRPTFGDNMRFFIGYQTYFMYLRYFFWNFSGKQNDVQGMFTGNVRDGNWITGIPFIDNSMYGDQSLMPQSLQDNKAHNKLFMLPFILGLVGMFYQFKKRGDDGLVTFLLFFMTGFAIIIYLNQAGYQPRERDYAYVGSFYAFAIWIGLAVPYFAELASKWDEKMVKYMAIGGGACAVIMIAAGTVTDAGLALGFGFALVFGLVAFGLPYILKFLGNKRNIVYVATTLSLLVPIWMGMQEWDDHDRSKKQLARDLAKDYLESCAPNAILFTFGDNDTYPLWYAQEVEGIRPDIRVINTSLLGIDWYINELRYKINKSDAIDVMWSEKQIEGNNRNYVRYNPNPAYPNNRYYNLDSIMRYYVGSDDPSKQMDEGGDLISSYPVKKFSIPVDVATVRENHTVNPDDSVVTSVNFDVNKNILMKNDLAMLDIIAANKWKRPIYFTMDYGDLGFGSYVRRDGLSYRLVPVANSQVNTDHMLDVVLHKFGFGNAGLQDVYFDEENRRHLNIIRRADAELALDLAFKNRKDDAIKVLKRTDDNMLQSNFPYGMASRGNDQNRISMLFLQACYQAGDTTLAAKVDASVKKDLNEQMRFYNSLTGMKADYMSYEKSSAQELLDGLQQMEQQFGPKKPVLNENPVIKTFDSTPKKDSPKTK
ncbi:MAG TPA: DUF2723 domain-containing protein [Chitinophagaceae bacterium]|nr:DUF2723 domain-containing protein [Chitinophagaceae bacterium]